MIKRLLVWVCIFAFPGIACTQELPLGYLSYYTQSGKSDQFLGSLTICNPGYWSISKDKSGAVISSVEKDSSGQSLFPATTGIIRDMVFGELVLEFEFFSDLNVNGNAGFCFLGPVKTHDIYYACVFGSDSVSFYYINRNIPEFLDAEPLAVKQKAWNHVKITRDLLKRSFAITINKDSRNQVVFTDARLVMGHIGFGTVNTRSMIRNINIWAPTVITSEFNCGPVHNNH